MSECTRAVFSYYVMPSAWRNIFACARYRVFLSSLSARGVVDPCLILLATTHPHGVRYTHVFRMTAPVPFFLIISPPPPLKLLPPFFHFISIVKGGGQGKTRKKDVAITFPPRAIGPVEPPYHTRGASLHRAAPFLSSSCYVIAS